ncbi:minor capsid protein [Dactylosporangium sp. CS-033363]|uniref:minor capsid protein n=1 Tax=Dactylosporangium sp. CS-033363 TaxID=3239935 RepID=UPI003D927B62
MTLTEEFCRLLDAVGLGRYAEHDADTSGDIYPMVLPATPDECLAVTFSAGRESDSVLPFDEPRLQVRVRGPRNDVYAPEDRAAAIYSRLHGLGGIRLPGGTRLVGLYGSQGGGFPMGQDADGRMEFVINFRADVRRATFHRM